MYVVTLDWTLSASDKEEVYSRISKDGGKGGKKV
jgi:hypothetical protein